MDIVSDCCSAKIYEMTDFCCACGEHCNAIDLGQLDEAGDPGKPVPHEFEAGFTKEFPQGQ